MRALFVILLLLAVAVSASAQHVDDEIVDFSKAVMAAARTGDADVMASYFTEDATLLEREQPVAEGRDAILDYYRQAYAEGGAEMTIVTEEYLDVGDHGYARGTYEIGPAGQEIEEYGWVALMAREGDELRIRRLTIYPLEDAWSPQSMR